MEKTLVIIKPEAFQRKRVSAIINIIVDHGFRIVKLGKVRVSRSLVWEHYQGDEEKEHFPRLLSQFTERDVLVLIVQKPNAIAEMRQLIGPFRSGERIKGTIRRRFMRTIGKELDHLNYIHGSSSPEEFRREESIWSKFLDE